MSKFLDSKFTSMDARRRSSDDWAQASTLNEVAVESKKPHHHHHHLGFFSSSKSGHSHGHARAESTSATMSSSTSLLQASPQKSTYGHGRATPSNSSISALAMASTVNLTSTSSLSDPWGMLHVHLLPLFNGEPLSAVIESLNVLVKRHIHTVVSSTPSKALGTLTHDAAELIATGMVTLNSKLIGIDDEKLVSRVVEIWGFFWDQVLTYVEAVLLPLQTDDLLSSLSRSKGHRGTSPSRPMPTSTQNTTVQIDVRALAIQSFRDQVILPLAPRLYSRLSNLEAENKTTTTYPQSRLQQMLLVLASQGQKKLVVLSLSAPIPQPTAGEAAVANLLKVIRRSPNANNPRVNSGEHNPKLSPKKTIPPPTFVSGGIPRDRRGRVAQKPEKSAEKMKRRPGRLVGLEMTTSESDDNYTDNDDDAFFSSMATGEETPRNPGANGGGSVGLFGRRGGVFGLSGETGMSYGAGADSEDREREREFLEALRSPDVTINQPSSGPRASVGWGLGAGGKSDHGFGISPDTNNNDDLDWDDTQDLIEKMVGMKVKSNGSTNSGLNGNGSVESSEQSTPRRPGRT